MDFQAMNSEGSNIVFFKGEKDYMWLETRQPQIEFRDSLNKTAIFTRYSKQIYIDLEVSDLPAWISSLLAGSQANNQPSHPDLYKLLNELNYLAEAKLRKPNQNQLPNDQKLLDWIEISAPRRPYFMFVKSSDGSYFIHMILEVLYKFARNQNLRSIFWDVIFKCGESESQGYQFKSLEKLLEVEGLGLDDKRPINLKILMPNRLLFYVQQTKHNLTSGM